MNNFYKNITQPQQRRNKADALRQAQLDLLNCTGGAAFQECYAPSPTNQLLNQRKEKKLR